MNIFTLEDLECPQCRGKLSLYDKFPSCFATTDSNELLEGIIECIDCRLLYPIVAGVSILLKDIENYICTNYSLILSIATEFDISKEMIDFFQSRGYDLHHTGYGETFWDNALGSSIYISAHYDNEAMIPDFAHPLYSLISDYCKSDLYSNLIGIVLSQSTMYNRVLDIGCNVGGMINRLAEHSEFVYGIDTSFRNALIARQILRHQPNRLADYRLFREGSVYIKRDINIEAKMNCEIFVASGLELPFRESFDLVNISNLIDVVSLPKSLIGAACKKLCSGGYLLNTDPYFWNPTRTPMGDWISRDNFSDDLFVRQLNREGLKIVSEKDNVLWMLRVYDRFFSIWLNHCVLAQKT